MIFTNIDWEGLTWTPWIAFSDRAAFKNLPSCPGVYRVRAVNGKELFYIGETGRDLRERLGSGLRLNTMQEMMPYNDPHTAAPSLWAWRHAESFDFECSAAPIALADDKKIAMRLRKGLEHYLLWRYRLDFGASTYCNHGHFHSHYVKSTNRKRGIRGYRLPDHLLSDVVVNTSYPPLKLTGSPFETNWMGLTWHQPDVLEIVNVAKVAASPGVYKIFDLSTNKLLYIGETEKLHHRLISHARKIWGNSKPLFSYVQLPYDTPAYQRHEIENDLIAGFYASTKQVPDFQFTNHH